MWGFLLCKWCFVSLIKSLLIKKEDFYKIISSDIPEFFIFGVGPNTFTPNNSMQEAS